MFRATAWRTLSQNPSRELKVDIQFQVLKQLYFKVSNQLLVNFNLVPYDARSSGGVNMTTQKSTRTANTSQFVHQLDPKSVALPLPETYGVLRWPDSVGRPPKRVVSSSFNIWNFKSNCVEEFAFN